MPHQGPTALVILDGFGHSPATQYNAVAQAQTPNLDTWRATCPHTLLNASGPAVGLLDRYIGNSEVGHLTIGAGRIIKQPVTRIHDAIADKSFFKNPTLTHYFNRLKETGAPLHLMGLLSDAGVHSDIEHLYAYLGAAYNHGVPHVYIHAFLDGRDTPPRSAHAYLDHLENTIAEFGYGSLGSIHGRFYAMDRDNNWDRTKKSYDVLTHGGNDAPRPWQDVLEYYYEQDITDEFMPPTAIDPTSTIRDGDGVVFFNFRPDRARQLTQSFIEKDFKHFRTTPLDLACFITPVSYKKDLHTTALFDVEPIHNTLKDILAHHNKTIFTIAETEKYAHVTYFFTGGREKPIKGETQRMIKSLPARTYVEQPEMSATKITDTVLDSLSNNPCDFYLINYANADMVAHSGDLQATIKAVECLDRELKRLYDEIVIKQKGILYITADHGNAEDMFNPETNQPRTAHTTNPVPFIVVSAECNASEKLPLNGLSDIASFILGQMGIGKTPQTGKTP